MTFFYLIRHEENDTMGWGIAGRRAGVSLNALGREHAEALAQKLGSEGIASIYSSPLERAQETAEPLARKLKLEVKVCEGLVEVDYGEWTGMSFEELSKLERWEDWNRFRVGTRPPGGESMLEVQARVVGELTRIQTDFPGERVALFSHGDVIKAGLAYFLGVSLDLALRFEVSPGSWSILGMDIRWVTVFCVNRV